MTVTYPLLPAQEGILFHTLKDKREFGGVYVTQVVVQLRECLDVASFWKAWEIILERHALLTAQVEWEEHDRPIFRVLPQVQLSKKVLNISSLTSAQQEAVFQSSLRADRAQPFDLAHPPYMRFHLFQMAQEERLVWSIHHILLGMANSGVVVLKEVFEVYNALISHKKYSLSNLKPYEKVLDEVSHWQQGDAEKYWGDLFKGLSNITPLPLVDGYSDQSGSQLFENFLISSDDYQQCQRLTSQHKITLNTLVQATWGLLLKCYTGESDIVFGSVRAYPGSIVENCVGLFLSTLPVRLFFDESMTVLQYLKIVRTQQNGLREHVMSPLYKIKEWAGLSAQSALFNTVVDFKPLSLHSAVTQKESLHIVKDISFSVNTNYPLVLTVTDDCSSLFGALHYTKHLYSSAQIKKMVQHFKAIFNQLIYNVDASITSISMLSLEEKQLLEKWNQTTHEFETLKPVHQLFEDQVLKAPNKVAVELKGNTLTYQELNRDANLIAVALLQQQTAVGDLVGIYVGRGFPMICAALGILKSGAAYLPLDVNLPEQRLSYFLKDSRVKTILVEEVHSSFLKTVLQKDEAFRSLRVETIESLVENKKDVFNPGIFIPFQHLAYAIYTSGTTGVPQGVLVEHHAASNMALVHQDRLKISAKSRVLQFSNPMFDVSIAEWMSALISGASLCILPSGSHFVGATLASYLRSEKISVVLLPGSVLETLPKSPLESLKTIVVGGEVCSQATTSYWSAGRLFVNAYGLTETGVCVAMHEVHPKCASNVIGRPIYNNYVYVLGRNFELLPVGAVGELFVGGCNLARAYLNNESLTRKKFINNPFSHGHVLFRTGDLVKQLPDGALVFVGRRDNQVKIRGYRIELDEIVSVALQVSGVEQCVVLVHLDRFEHKIIVAYVRFSDVGDSKCVASLKHYLKAYLPRYMVPSCVVDVEKFPLTENGKVDRHALSEFFQKEESVAVFSGNTIEEQVSAVWRQLLCVDQVAVERNIFDLGAHSLLTLEASSKLSQVLSRPVDIVDLYQYPTIRSFSEHLMDEGVGLKKQSSVVV